MDKDEILEKSREENKKGDERIQQIRMRKIELCIIYTGAIALLIFYNYKKHSFPIISAITDLITVSFAAALGVNIYKYIVSRNKSLLYDIAFYSVLTIIALILTITR